MVSAVLVVVFLAQVIYRVFLLLLGAPDAGLWSAEAANELAARGLRGLALHRDHHPRRRPMPRPFTPAVDTPRTVTNWTPASLVSETELAAAQGRTGCAQTWRTRFTVKIGCRP
ncbi:MAG: hypothetical protein R3A10_10710 [Caldilineaceae bacterium]